MKILTFIKNIINSKSKVDERSIESMFPELKNGEYALIRADINTGIILTDQFKYARNDDTTVFKKLSDLNTAVKTAKEIVAENPTVEIGVYNHNKEIVYHMDIEKEKFHKPHLEFNYRLKQQIWIFRCIVRHDSATKYATHSGAKYTSIPLERLPIIPRQSTPLC